MAVAMPLHDPTYEEVCQFVEEDQTDKSEYVEGKYVCVDFAADFNKHATEKGIRCAEVNIFFEIKGHMIVAFNTVDKGIIYVEPQHDVIIPDFSQDRSTGMSWIGTVHADLRKLPMTQFNGL